MKRVVATTLAVAVAAAVLGVGPVGLGVWSPSPAAAQTKAEKRKAKRLFAQGKRLFRRKKYTQAIELFKKAYGFWQRHEIQFNIAYSYAKLGEKLKAVTHLKIYLKKATSGQKKRIPPLLIRMQQQVGILVVQVPDHDAEIFVDGRLAGTGRIEMIVLPGTRAVEIRVDGKPVASKDLDVLPGTEKVWELHKMPSKEKPTPRPTPRPMPTPVPTPLPRPKPAKGVHWAYFVTALGVAVAAAATAAGTGSYVQSLKKDYKDNPTKSLMDKGNTMKTVTNAMWGVAGGFAAVAGVLVFFTRWKKPERNTGGVSVMPEVGPGRFGVTFRMDFGSKR
jgi:hypothetical protein